MKRQKGLCWIANDDSFKFLVYPDDVILLELHHCLISREELLIWIMLILTTTECYFYWFKIDLIFMHCHLRNQILLKLCIFSGGFKVEYSNVFKGKKRILTE